MSLINEYIDKRMDPAQLEAELQSLIAEYNKHRNSFLFVYAAATGKQIPQIAIDNSDFYTIHDMLTKIGDVKRVDIFIETLGGVGEAAEEIVRFLRRRFESVSFVVCGQAKSAGTIIVLSGDEILMTETGSLGPIDAQLRIGRSNQSAYDYIEWVEEKRMEASKTGNLNPFDATMIAQITPGELRGVLNSLKFAEDLVVEWLVNYKFRNWNTTETRKVLVTSEMKRKRAQEIASELTNHSKWRSHGRSIKADDLEKLGLRINRVDEDPKLADIVYRIHTVCQLLFNSSTSFKVFATEKSKIFRSAAAIGSPIKTPQLPQADVAQFDQRCQKCGTTHKLYAKLADNKKVDEDQKQQGRIPFPNDSKLRCGCGFEIDLSGVKNEIELITKRKVIM